MSTAITARIICQRSSSRWSMNDISAPPLPVRLFKKSSKAIRIYKSGKDKETTISQCERRYKNAPGCSGAW